jgi:hypothetical protein
MRASFQNIVLHLCTHRHFKRKVCRSKNGTYISLSTAPCRERREPRRLRSELDPYSSLLRRRASRHPHRRQAETDEHAARMAVLHPALARRGAGILFSSSRAYRRETGPKSRNHLRGGAPRTACRMQAKTLDKAMAAITSWGALRLKVGGSPMSPARARWRQGPRPPLRKSTGLVDTDNHAPAVRAHDLHPPAHGSRRHRIRPDHRARKADRKRSTQPALTQCLAPAEQRCGRNPVPTRRRRSHPRTRQALSNNLKLLL